MGQACHGCGEVTVPVLDLGQQPAANNFPGPEDLAQPDLTWPLRIYLCRRCFLLQLDDASPPESSLPGPPMGTFSSTMQLHDLAFVDELMASLGGGSAHAQVVDLASHGGHLRPHFGSRGLSTVTPEATPLGDADGFGAAAAETLLEAGGPADLIVDNYLLAHVRNFNDFVAGLAILLSDEGAAVLEFDHLLPLVKHHRFDSFRHGHFSYISLAALTSALDRHALMAIQASPQPVFGGALRVRIVRRAADLRPDGSVAKIMADEARAQLERAETYAVLERQIRRTRRELRSFLDACRRDGRLVAAYGVPSRGNTLLNTCGVTTNLVAFTVDAAPAKQGRYLPGSRLPILAPEELDRRSVDDVLILTWDLVDEVMPRLSSVSDRGGRLFVPLPDVRVIS